MRWIAFMLLAATTAACLGDYREQEAPVQVTVSMKDLAYAPVSLRIPVGSTVTWVNDDPFPHTVTPVDKAQWGTEGSGDPEATWLGLGETWSHTFERPGKYAYFCIPHAAKQPDGTYAGMVGVVEVFEGAGSGAVRPSQPVRVDVAEIGADAFAVPPPVGRSQSAHVTFDITSKELVAPIGDGATYRFWTFNDQVPGPMLRVREGDTVTVNLHNDATSTMGHNIDFHAVTGPGGGAALLDAAPGETATMTFKALRAGLYVYHCAYQDPPLHVAHGMYGLILVEPPEGLPPVDREFYVVQGDLYSAYPASHKGHHAYDGDRAASEDPSFVVFNGRMGSLTGARQLQAEVGQTVRLYVGNGGPNLVSSFHVIGEIFDRAWTEASMSAPATNVQTTLIPAGGAAILDFSVEVPGDYFLVDHSLYRIHKGAFGILHVHGHPDPTLFRGGA